MAFFKRNKPDQDNDLPEEVKQYYQTEKSEHIGVAWLLAFVTLVVTVGLIAGLFLGGRWTYRKVANKDDASTSKTATTTQPQTASNDSLDSKNKPAESTPDKQPATETPDSSKPQTVAPAPAPAPQQPAPKPAPAAPATPPATPPASKPAPSPSPTPAPSQPATQNLANTGPGNTLGIFIFVTALSTLGHWQYMRRRTAKNY